MRDNQKLYVVCNGALSPGAQAVQGMHALTEFSMYWPEKYAEWYRQSNHLCFLSVPTERALDELCGRLARADVAFSSFREPDFNMALTAIAIEATDQASAELRGLSLALR